MLLYFYKILNQVMVTLNNLTSTLSFRTDSFVSWDENNSLRLAANLCQLFHTLLTRC